MFTCSRTTTLGTFPACRFLVGGVCSSTNMGAVGMVPVDDSVRSMIGGDM
jgi:hypothetical protein